MKIIAFTLISLLSLTGVTGYSQQVIQLYEGKAPGSESWTWGEQESMNNDFKTRTIYNVSQPTLTAYLPKPELATGTAVIVAPGGLAARTFAHRHHGLLGRRCADVGRSTKLYCGQPTGLYCAYLS